ncbi:MAG TPA: ATP-binding cassette domain-containing protein [Streptosporangiaceae bacterium]|nr:ATP-binding cassette domain-containing protein [Streptosporangiaceae bacterium]
MNRLLEIRGLSVQYSRPGRQSPMTALDGIDLDVDSGETMGIVGESGSGKTTLGNVILGLVRPVAGSVLLNGESILAATPRRRRQLSRDLQIIFQDPYGSLNPMRTVGQTLEEPLLAHLSLPRRQRRDRVADALDRVGLERQDGGRYPGSFSGGQRQRIAIARALMLDPKLVVCDEAVSALDLSIQSQILNLLRSLQQELGLTLLFISHDLAVVRYMSDRVTVLHHGNVAERGTAEQVCTRPTDPYTQRLLAAAPTPGGTRWRSAGSAGYEVRA